MKNTIHGLPRAVPMVLALVVVCAACSCRQVTKQYQKDGVQFSYNSSWKVVEDAPVNGNADVRAIQIEGPHNAVISLILVPASSEQTLEEYAKAVAKGRNAALEAKLSLGAVKTTVNKNTSEPTTGAIAGQQRQGILQQFTIDLLGTQVPHEARFYMVPGRKCKALVMSQVAAEHVAATRPGSDLILSSLAIEGPS